MLRTRCLPTSFHIRGKVGMPEAPLFRAQAKDEASGISMHDWVRLNPDSRHFPDVALP